MTTRIPLPIPPEEDQRLLSLLSYEILDTSNEEQLDELTRLTASIFQVPIALITVIDHDRQWFKSNFGLSLKQTARSISFCQFTIMSNAIFEVENTLTDERFVNNPLVIQDPYLRYYCGAPLMNEKGYRMGALAILDRVPRKLEAGQEKTLKLLARQVVNFFELNMKKKELEKEKLHLEERVMQRTRELEEKMAELKQRDEKLISVNNELNRLIYRASHDLLGPLKTLQGITHLAIQEANVENIHNYLRLAYTTEQKLDYALVNLLKVVSIKDASDFKLIPWNEVIETALVNAKKRVNKKVVWLEADISLSRQFVSDQLLVEMMMEELFVNSMQYNLEEEAVITLNMGETNESVEITIQDNGVGILKETREKIFEMFYRSPASKGSGLGLYIVKKVAEKLKGKISVHSKTNSGATFTIQLPFQSMR